MLTWATPILGVMLATACEYHDERLARADATPGGFSGSGGSAGLDAIAAGTGGAAAMAGASGTGGGAMDGGDGEDSAEDALDSSASGGSSGSPGFDAQTDASANGAPCADDSSCASGWCVDAVCCDGPCTGLCLACSAKKKGSGDDGACGPIVWADPDDECNDEGVEACGENGLCNQGTCATYPNGTICHLATCSVGFYTSSSMCMGGACFVDGVSCAPFDCVPGGCKTQCASNTDGFVGYVCNLATHLCG